MVTPDYYKDFKCIGSECKNNCCCGGWDIEVDDEAIDRFAEIKGEFGEIVRASVSDENVFIRKNGKCPMLSDNGLCEMVMHGEKLCTVCDEYPRFTEYFGDYIERGISLSCEEAARIILDNKEQMYLMGEKGECDDAIFRLLYASRNDIFRLLEDRDIDIQKRIRLVLDYGEKLQEKINNNDYSEFHYCPVDRMVTPKDNKSVFTFLQTLDYLDDTWYDILKKSSDVHIDEIQTEQIAVYFVYRYFLKAVFDCDALQKLKLMAISVVAIVGLADVCGNVYESAGRYSVEVEHNEENIEMIYDEFLFNDEFSTDNIISMIK